MKCRVAGFFPIEKLCMHKIIIIIVITKDLEFDVETKVLKGTF